MKLLVLASALALSNAFILPDEQVFGELAVEQREKAQSLWDKLPSPKEITEKLGHRFEDAVNDFSIKAEDMFDHMVEAASDTVSYYTDEDYESAFDMHGWLQPPLMGPPLDHPDGPHPPGPPPHGHPEDGPHPPHHGPGKRPGGKPGKRPPHHGPPHRHPHHPHKPNSTIYELIAKSKYTTKLAKLISEYDDLVDLLNGTAANYTVFAPTDKAFEKIPENAPKPSKEFLKKLLTYHVSADFYPAGRVFHADTIPTAYKEKAIGAAQRIAVKLGFKGLTLNFYSRVIAPNIVCSPISPVTSTELTLRLSLPPMVSSTASTRSSFHPRQSARSSTSFLKSSAPSCSLS